MFKLQHPNDLITRLFMLEYMRELGADKLYSKATPEQRKNMFYKFEDNEGNTSVDLNWEALLFECTILHLEGLLKHFIKEVEEIELKNQQKLKILAAQEIEQRLTNPVDINLMDVAAAKMKENNSGKLIV